MNQKYSPTWPPEAGAQRVSSLWAVYTLQLERETDIPVKSLKLRINNYSHVILLACPQGACVHIQDLPGCTKDARSLRMPSPSFEIYASLSTRNPSSSSSREDNFAQRNISIQFRQFHSFSQKHIL